MKNRFIKILIFIFGGIALPTMAEWFTSVLTKNDFDGESLSWVIYMLVFIIYPLLNPKIQASNKWTKMIFFVILYFVVYLLGLAFSLCL